MSACIFPTAQKRWVFPVNNFSVNYGGGYRKFYACHFIAPNAQDRIEIGDYEANASGRGMPPLFLIKALCLPGLYEEGKEAGVTLFS